MPDDLHNIATAIAAEWQIQLSQQLSEEDLLNLLADKIAAIIAQRPQPFYQLMYRLDISERKLNAVTGDSDMAHKVARLVYERQLQKVQSRKNSGTTAHDNDPDLKW